MNILLIKMSIEKTISLNMCKTLTERLNNLKMLREIINDKRERLKIDIDFRKSYTNEEICKRNIENNGEMAPPILLRQYGRVNSIKNEYIISECELLEAQNNLDEEYRKNLIEICTFNIDELKFIVENHIDILTISQTDFPIFCNINNTTHILKYFGENLKFDFEINKFFLTRFIMEDIIIPLSKFNLIFDIKNQSTVYLKI